MRFAMVSVVCVCVWSCLLTVAPSVCVVLTVVPCVCRMHARVDCCALCVSC